MCYEDNNLCLISGHKIQVKSNEGKTIFIRAKVTWEESRGKNTLSFTLFFTHTMDSLKQIVKEKSSVQN